MSPTRMSPTRMSPTRMSPTRMSPTRMSPTRMSPPRPLGIRGAGPGPPAARSSLLSESSGMMLFGQGPRPKARSLWTGTGTRHRNTGTGTRHRDTGTGTRRLGLGVTRLRRASQRDSGVRAARPDGHRRVGLGSESALLYVGLASIRHSQIDGTSRLNKYRCGHDLTCKRNRVRFERLEIPLLQTKSCGKRKVVNAANRCSLRTLINSGKVVLQTTI
jgi:hypothetical protein